jgi:serine/threonine protein kinase
VSYRIEKKLGEGGTAAGFLAIRQAPDSQAPVVIKIILPHVALESGETALMVIKKEAVALGRLNERVPPTPYVVRLIDTGTATYQASHQPLTLPWLALEYVHGGVEGTTLGERVQTSVAATGYAFEPARAAHCIR